MKTMAKIAMALGCDLSAPIIRQKEAGFAQEHREAIGAAVLVAPPSGSERRHAVKKPDTYCYPAVFVYEDGYDIAVEFPDLGVATCGENDADALASARELLGCVPYGMEEDGEDIPAPSPLSSVEGAHVALVDVFMPSVRMAQSNKSVNRTVTLPAWLNALAVERGVNFSQTLQAALREQLHA